MRVSKLACLVLYNNGNDPGTDVNKVFHLAFVFDSQIMFSSFPSRKERQIIDDPSSSWGCASRWFALNSMPPRYGPKVSKQVKKGKGEKKDRLKIEKWIDFGRLCDTLSLTKKNGKLSWATCIRTSQPIGDLTVPTQW